MVKEPTEANQFRNVVNESLRFYGRLSTDPNMLAGAHVHDSLAGTLFPRLLLIFINGSEYVDNRSCKI